LEEQRYQRKNMKRLSNSQLMYHSHSTTKNGFQQRHSNIMIAKLTEFSMLTSLVWIFQIYKKERSSGKR
jgi:hypothetical protein